MENLREACGKRFFFAQANKIHIHSNNRVGVAQTRINKGKEVIKTMKRLILHWSAGGYNPTFYDKQFYHYLVDGDGAVHSGIYPPEANLDCSDGKYAAHCGGGNTGSIGVALCAMAGYQNRLKYGSYPIKKKQLEAFLKLCAELCIKYNIPVTQQSVMTHYEFGKLHPESSSAGKIDITYLPPYPEVAQAAVGGFLRQKIKWYKGRLSA